MKYEFYYIFFNVFYLIIIFILINKNISLISFTYPSSISLSNGNIFIIHKSGISICNSALSEIINNITIFNEDEFLTPDSLSRIISVFENGFIFNIINDKIYIFDEEKNYLYKDDNTILNGENPSYYTLIPMELKGGIYYYIIGFVDNNKLSFLYYKYDIDNNENRNIYTQKRFQHQYFTSELENLYNSFDIENNGLSCQYMINEDKGEVLVCFFIIIDNGIYYIAIEHFSISNTEISVNREFTCYHFSIENSSIIKSAINYDHTKSLICIYTLNGYSKCITYDINIEYSSGVYTSYNYNSTKCENNYYGYKVDYYIENNNDDYFIFSCIKNNGTILYSFFEGDLGENCAFVELFKFTDCQEIYGYSILYINNINDYFIVSDVTCNEKKYPLDILFPSDDDNSTQIIESIEIYEKDNITETVKNTNEEISENLYSSYIAENNKISESLYISAYISENIEISESLYSSSYISENIEISENFSILNSNDISEIPETSHNLANPEKTENIEISNPIITTINEYENILDEDKIKCKDLEKCQTYNKESLSKCLCLTCNNNKGYYLLNNKLSKEKSLEIYGRYIDCVNNITKPSNFYFNKENNDYEECYETCNTCIYSGDKNENNCSTCENNYIKEPYLINSFNCVLKCPFLYYYNSYGKYKCTVFPKCPDDFNLMIKEKKKCIDNCEKDDLYKYKYNGECLKECPAGTTYKDFKCEDINPNKCLLTENEFISINENITDNEIEKIAKSYDKEFQYTDNHVSVLKNNIYSIIVYRNKDCISDLSLEYPKVDFEECDKKLKNNYEIEENLVMIVITKKMKDIHYKKMISYSTFEPNLGTKLPIEKLCKDESLIVYEDILIKLNNSKIDINSLLFFANQNINVFNLSSAFYTDICYNFESPLDKDITLKDRILLYYPNVTLCESGCHIKGVNLTTFKAICECKLNNIMSNNFLEDNLLFKSQFGEIEEIIIQTNVEVLKCFKYIFSMENFNSCIGAFLILVLIIIQIITTIIYCKKSLFLIRKYIFGITSKFILHLSSQKNNYNENIQILNSAPPKKKARRKSKKNEIKETEPVKARKKKYSKKNNMKTEILNNNKFHNINENNNIMIFSNSNYYENNMPSISKIVYPSKFYKINQEEIGSRTENEIKNLKKLSNSSDIQIDLMNYADTYNIDIQEYLSTEIDDMEYEDVIKRDERKFCQYFNDKLKINQILLNTFFTKEHLRPRTIKIILFILDIDLYLFVNALFFNEDYISEVFNSTKEEKFFTFVPRSYSRFFYTTLVGIIVNYIIDFFFIEEKKIKGIFKREKENLFSLKFEISKICKMIKKRYILFIILSFIIISFTLFFILCFNKVYPHMRDEWIKSSIIIIIIMQILSILECLLETILRFISFKCKSEKIYKLSLILS